VVMSSPPFGLLPTGPSGVPKLTPPAGFGLFDSVGGNLVGGVGACSAPVKSDAGIPVAGPGGSSPVGLGGVGCVAGSPVLGPGSSVPPSRSVLRGFAFSRSRMIHRKFAFLQPKLLFAAIFTLLKSSPHLLPAVDQACSLLMQTPLPKNEHPPSSGLTPTTSNQLHSQDLIAPLLLKTRDSYTCGTGLVTSEARWPGLGQVGSARLVPADIIAAYDHGREFKPPKGNCAVRDTVATPGMVEFVNDMSEKNLLVELGPTEAPTISMSLRLKANGKPLAIADCRPLMARDRVAPARFSLPEVGGLLRFKGNTDELYMSKLDLSNAYWSTLLPSSLPPIFKFRMGGRVFGMVCLPFGWGHSPKIFQEKFSEVIGRCLSQVDLVVIRSLFVGQYLDDVLVVGFGKGRVQDFTALLVHEIHEAGWLVNYKKSILSPVKELEWLGKSIKVSSAGFVIEVLKDTLVNIIALFLFVSAKANPQRVLRSLTGLVSWAAIHFRLPIAFLHAAHSFVHRPHSVFAPQQVRVQLSKAIAMLSLPVGGIPVDHAGFELVEDLGKLPWLYVDAAADEGFGGIVFSTGSSGGDFMLSLPLPRGMCGAEHQQLAELYMLKRGVQVALAKGLDKVVVISDNISALFSGLKMSTGVAHRARSKVLRQLAGLVCTVGGESRFAISVLLAHLCGSINPADFPSRPGKFGCHALGQVPVPPMLGSLVGFLRCNPSLIAWGKADWLDHKQGLLRAWRLCGVTC